ncbi:hypothetical protein BCR44DRAFT_184325 [Catenaria anguillulae PL171]|uniref:Secreted protein n=1 Tax=Catenaria anguillulae PL171 TaxID=765915 RepID=A0A1Y2HLW0_9FUNG|nr:hypothetical protein BCR44DRAFT_184325 [Catenaria anguillulae PL171]
MTKLSLLRSLAAALVTTPIDAVKHWRFDRQHSPTRHDDRGRARQRFRRRQPQHRPQHHQPQRHNQIRLDLLQHVSFQWQLQQGANATKNSGSLGSQGSAAQELE